MCDWDSLKASSQLPEVAGLDDIKQNSNGARRIMGNAMISSNKKNGKQPGQQQMLPVIHESNNIINANTRMVPVLIELDHNGNRKHDDTTPTMMMLSQADQHDGIARNNSDSDNTSTDEHKQYIEEDGEYWLGLHPPKNDQPNPIDETQATYHNDGNAPHPARPTHQLLPLKFMTQPLPQNDCYVCIDVVTLASTVVAIKDMRLPIMCDDDSEESNENVGFDLLIARRCDPTALTPNTTLSMPSDPSLIIPIIPIPDSWKTEDDSNNDEEEHNNDNMSDNKDEEYTYQPYFERLPRRQLRFLSEGDRIVTYHRTSENENLDEQTNYNPVGLVLQFQLEERRIDPAKKQQQQAVEATVASPSKQEEEEEDDFNRTGPETQALLYDEEDDEKSETNKPLYLPSDSEGSEGDVDMDDSKDENNAEREQPNANLLMPITQPNAEENPSQTLTQPEEDPSQTQPVCEILGQPSEESSSSDGEKEQKELEEDTVLKFNGKDEDTNKAVGQDNSNKTQSPVVLTKDEMNLDEDSDATELEDNDHDTAAQLPQVQEEEKENLKEETKSQTKEVDNGEAISKATSGDNIEKEKVSTEPDESKNAGERPASVPANNLRLSTQREANSNAASGDYVEKAEEESKVPRASKNAVEGRASVPGNNLGLLTQANQTASDDDDTTLGDEDNLQHDDDDTKILDKPAPPDKITTVKDDEENDTSTVLDHCSKDPTIEEGNHDSILGRTIGQGTQHASDGLLSLSKEEPQALLLEDKTTTLGDDTNNRDEESTDFVKEDEAAETVKEDGGEKGEEEAIAENFIREPTNNGTGKRKESSPTQDHKEMEEEPPKKRACRKATSPESVATKKETSNADENSGKPQTTSRPRRGKKQSEENVIEKTVDGDSKDNGDKVDPKTPAKDDIDEMDFHDGNAEMDLKPSTSSLSDGSGSSGRKNRTRHSRKKANVAKAADETEKEEASFSSPTPETVDTIASNSRPQRRPRGMTARTHIDEGFAGSDKLDLTEDNKSLKLASPSTPALSGGIPDQNDASTEHDGDGGQTRTRRAKRGQKAVEMTPNADDNPPSTTRKRSARTTSVRRTATKRSRISAPDFYKECADEEIRVITTGVALSKSELAMIEKIGGTLLEDVKDASDATHVIAGDKKNGISMRRTPKLMIGFCRTSNIVDLDWLRQSSKAERPLPAKRFQVVDDTKAEETYNFSMKESLARGDELRLKGDKLLGGWWIHVCKGVAGQKKAGKRTPPEPDIKLIAEAAGAVWLPSLTPNAVNQEGFDASHLLVITSDPEGKREVSTKAVANALESGARKQTLTWLFDCIFAQSFQ